MRDAASSSEPRITKSAFRSRLVLPLHKQFEINSGNWFPSLAHHQATGAESGALSIFIGGNEQTVLSCWPLFEVLGNPQRIIYGGPPGTGQVMKVVQQLKERLLDAARMEVMAFGVRSKLGNDERNALRHKSGDKRPGG